MRTWLIGGAAALVGFGFGAWSARSTVEKSLPSPAVTAEKSMASSLEPRPPPLDLPPFSAGDFDTRLGLSLARLKAAGKDEMLAQLQRVTEDRDLLPELANGFRKELWRRLTDLGAAGDAISFGDARQREAAVEAVIKTLARRDPAAAEAMIVKLPAGEQQQLAAGALLGVLGEIASERGLAFLRAHPDLREKDDSFFREWAKKEPQVAAEKALELEKEMGGSFLHDAVYQWSENDPAAASKWIEKLPPEERNRGRMAYMNALVNKDPSTALEVLLTRPELDVMFVDWIGSKMVENSADAEALLARVPPGSLRTRLVGGIANALRRDDPVAALKWTQTLLPGEREAAVRSIFEDLAFSDPAGAIDLAAKNLQGAAAEQAMISVARQWMESDFESGFSTLVQHLPGDALKRAFSEVMTPNYSLIGKDPGPRFELLAKLDPATRPEAFRALGAAWGMVDPQGVREHLGDLDPENRTPFVEGLLRGIDANPGLAAEFAKWLPPDRQSANAREIARAISANDPAGAAAFLLGLPGDQRSLQPAMRDLVRDWSCDDPAAAANFAGSLPPGETRDAVKLEFARQLKNFDLEGATRQLADIAGAASRAALQRELAETWRRVNPSRGKTLLLSAANSEAERQSIRQILEAH